MDIAAYWQWFSECEDRIHKHLRLAALEARDLWATRVDDSTYWREWLEATFDEIMDQVPSDGRKDADS